MIIGLAHKKILKKLLYSASALAISKIKVGLRNKYCWFPHQGFFRKKDTVKSPIEARTLQRSSFCEGTLIESGLYSSHDTFFAANFTKNFIGFYCICMGQLVKAGQFLSVTVKLYRITVRQIGTLCKSGLY